MSSQWVGEGREVHPCVTRHVCVGGAHLCDLLGDDGGSASFFYHALCDGDGGDYFGPSDVCERIFLLPVDVSSVIHLHLVQIVDQVAVEYREADQCRQEPPLPLRIGHRWLRSER